MDIITSKVAAGIAAVSIFGFTGEAFASFSIAIAGDFLIRMATANFSFDYNKFANSVPGFPIHVPSWTYWVGIGIGQFASFSNTFITWTY